MVKHLFSSQRNIIITTLAVLIWFSLFTIYDTRAAFSDIDLSSTALDPDTTGFVITGNAAGDQLGNSVSTAGDIDNDGYEDIIISAFTKNSNQGAAYVIYGGAKSSMSNIFLNTQTLNPLTTGFIITGKAAGDYLGWSVSSAGDIDNDGYDDIIIGARYQDSSRGAAYVIYGGERSSMINIPLSTTTLDSLTTGFVITGNAAGDNLGCSVSTAGDINNDGYDDIIIGACAKNINAGAVYVIYGGSKSSMSNIILSTQSLDPHATGFMMAGNAASDTFGQQVKSAGDIDQDGYDDIIVGAFSKNNYQGAAYVIYGGAKSSMSNIFLSTQTLDPLTTGFMMIGNAIGDLFGNSVSTAGDINNDGYDDIIIGAHGVNSNQGAAYVVYGGPKSSMSNIVLSTAALDPLTTGLMITGNAASGYFGFFVSTAGDINNDRYGDIIIGAHGANSNQGAAYVIYGAKKSSMTNIVLSTTKLDPLTTGFKITGNAIGDYFGFSVSPAGDFNQDGFRDIIVGASRKGSSQGAAYLITPAQCTTYCNECSSFTGCTECKDPYLLYQAQCFDSCPNTTFTSAGTCQKCSTHCNVCSSSSSCTECISPFVLYESYCIASCPETMFNSTNKCKDCPSYCSTCISQDSCQVCYEGYTLLNSTCVLSSQGAQQQATQTIASATKGIGSVLCVGSTIFPLSALVSKIVQNTRYLNLSVTSDLEEIYQTWDTDLISWDPPNVFSSQEDHFKISPSLFSQYNLGSPFLVNFWPTLMNIGIGFTTYLACFLLQKLFESEKYEGWAYSLVKKLVSGSFNFALVQVAACLDDILFYLVIDAKTNPFNSSFSWASLIFAIIFLTVGCFFVFFNFWLDKKYQGIKKQGMKDLEAFKEKNKNWELFYSDFNDNDFWSQSLFALLVIRSSLSSFLIALFYDYPLMQTSFLMMLDVTVLLFLYFKNPFNMLRGKLAQYYFEIITLLVHICALILSLQDSFDQPSENFKTCMSKGIIYLNTALTTGAIGFMFIEIYKTLSEKTRAARKNKLQTVPEENQETQNLTANPLQPTESQNSIETARIKKFYFRPENKHDLAHSNFISIEDSQGPELNSREIDLSNRINHQRNQIARPALIRHRPRTLNQRQQINTFRIPNQIGRLSNNENRKITFGN